MAGLTLPPSVMGPQPQGTANAPISSYGGVVAISHGRLSAAAKAKAQARQGEPEITHLVGYIKERWEKALLHKRLVAEPRMFKALRQRQGEYDPDKLSQIKQQGGSEVYMTLTGNKCRSASSWIKDVYMGKSGDRPWSADAEAIVELPPDVQTQVTQGVAAFVRRAIENGYKPAPEETYALAQMVKTHTLNSLREDAQVRAERMADKMEAQLAEGGWSAALADFVDDLVTFDVACMKGPIVRRKRKLTWEPGPNGTYSANVKDKLVPEWGRISPFDIYPSPDATDPEDGYFFERHRLSRASLLELKGVDGYDDDAIDMVLDEYYANGWQEWLYGDAERAQIEGRSPPYLRGNPDGKINALQFWGAINGRTLVDDWGMSKKEVPDVTEDYEVEAWLINRVVIKCVLNPDPLKRRPYFITSYAKEPGGFYGDAVPGIIEDIQAVCNAAARALVNNAGIASGPQVAITVDRMPPGEDLTSMHPWKLWQFTSDPTGSAQQPISFFQPNPMVAELMGVYEKFEQKADDYTGIPKYLVGGETTGGIGRTSSGLAMMIQNAGKAIKQVISNIDVDVMEPLLRRLYDWNMRYATDPDLKGSVSILVRGASAVVAKDAIHLRRNEFLQATSNPTDMQIIGAEGRAVLLREIAKDLDVNVDKIVPDAEAMKLKGPPINQQMAAQAQAQAQPGGPSGQASPSGPQPLPPPPQGMPPGARGPLGPPMPGPAMHPQLRSGGSPASAIMTPMARPVNK